MLPEGAGTVEDDFGAFDRFKGLVLFTEAKMQAKFALDHLHDADGLFVPARVVDGEVVAFNEAAAPYDQYVMVMALADVLSVLDHADRWQDVLRDDATAEMLHGELDRLYALVSRIVAPQTVADLAWAARADVWFASVTRDFGLQQLALANLRARGDALLELSAEGPVEHAQRLRGLIEAGRVLDDSRYTAAAEEDFAAIETAFDQRTGSLDGVATLRANEVADIVGALNAVDRFGPPAVDTARVSAVLVPFYKAVINIGGMQLSAPPREMAAAPFELERLAGCDECFAYQTVPTPMAAGGVAPVTATAVSFDDGRWSVSDQRFDTHAAMYLANEDIWLFGLASGFPQVDRQPLALRFGPY